MDNIDNNVFIESLAAAVETEVVGRFENIGRSSQRNFSEIRGVIDDLESELGAMTENFGRNFDVTMGDAVEAVINEHYKDAQRRPADATEIIENIYAQMEFADGMDFGVEDYLRVLTSVMGFTSQRLTKLAAYNASVQRENKDV